MVRCMLAAGFFLEASERRSGVQWQVEDPVVTETIGESSGE